MSLYRDTLPLPLLELSLELSLFFCLEGSEEYKDFFDVSRAQRAQILKAQFSSISESGRSIRCSTNAEHGILRKMLLWTFS